jgi:DNA-binding beta-propeller fold protein YncE
VRGRPHFGLVDQCSTETAPGVAGMHRDLFDVGVLVDLTHQEVGHRPVAFVGHDPGPAVTLVSRQLLGRRRVVVGHAIHLELSERFAGGPFQFPQPRNVLQTSQADHPCILAPPRGSNARLPSPLHTLLAVTGTSSPEEGGSHVSTVLGSGEHTYQVEEEQWGELPSGWDYGDVGGVAVDRDDNVYVFNRGPHPMVVFDRQGSLLGSWGEGLFPRAHGLHFGPDDTLYCTDDGDHTVRKCTLEGKVLLEIGIPGRPAPAWSGQPFSRCTHTALSPEGDLYVSDGYNNARIHKFAPDGRLLFSWGEPGVGPGQFNLPHNIGCDAEGWVYVADRENHRVQVFDGSGRFETQWHDVHRPSALYTAPGSDPLCYVGECGPPLEFQRGATNLGPRVSIFTHDGQLVTRLGTIPTLGPGAGQFISPHGICVDSRGDIYVGEVSHTGWPNVAGPDVPYPSPLRALQKLVKIPAATTAPGQTVAP